MIDEREDRVLTAIERLDRRFDGVGQIAARVARLEGEAVRLRESVVMRSDLAMLSARIEGLGSRIDSLGEQVAATAPRLRLVETSVGELRAISARQGEVESLDRALAELAARVDAHDQGQSARAARLSSQMTAWLVSLLLLIVGAMVSYALVAMR